MSEINVYIDGACTNNGSKNAKAGYAVFFGENDPRNEYARVMGKQSNNTGELTAFIRCLQILQNEIKNNSDIHIYTDSEYVMKCATTYGSKLHAKGWKSKNEIPNLELVKQAYTMLCDTQSVKLHYIEAHTNKQDKHSKGNAEADRLARLSIGKQEASNADIISLDWITFDTKDAAKALGAKWNQKKKTWYIESDISEEAMQELIKLQTYKIAQQSSSACKKYLQIPYAKKEVAKSLGARWDSSVKSWYYVDGQISEENKNKLSAL